MTKKLYRSYKDRIIGGVAGGLAEYLSVDVTLIRLITALIMLTGAGIVIYIIAWAIIPMNPGDKDNRNGAEEIRDSVEKIAQQIKEALNYKKEVKMNQYHFSWIGWVLVVLGIFFLLETFLGSQLWSHFWPMILIIFGIVLIFRGLEK